MQFWNIAIHKNLVNKIFMHQHVLIYILILYIFYIRLLFSFILCYVLFEYSWIWNKTVPNHLTIWKQTCQKRSLKSDSCQVLDPLQQDQEKQTDEPGVQFLSLYFRHHIVNVAFSCIVFPMVLQTDGISESWHKQLWLTSLLFDVMP